jgi:hypothetical protein
MTSMQELLEWVRATLPMDLETPQMIEQKIESMLEKEKEQIMDAYMEGGDWESLPQPRFDNYYNQTFNTKER